MTTTTTIPNQPKTKDEQWAALLEADQDDQTDLRELLDYVAEVWNGGHEQWLDHRHQHSLVPDLLDGIPGCKAGAALARTALTLQERDSDTDGHYCDEDEEPDESTPDALGELDTIFYDGLDERVVAALYTRYVVAQ